GGVRLPRDREPEQATASPGRYGRRTGPASPRSCLRHSQPDLETAVDQIPPLDPFRQRVADVRTLLQERDGERRRLLRPLQDFERSRPDEGTPLPEGQ